MVWLTREVFKKRVAENGQKYWTKTENVRWQYMQRTIEIAKSINPVRVLEIGPNGITLSNESDQLYLHTTDQDSYNSGRRYKQDARAVPWPFEDKSYDLVIALQVLEHLSPKQTDVFNEIVRITKHAIISLPLRWRCPHDPIHHMIDYPQIREWTGHRRASVELLGKHKKRILLHYQF